jgi:hypothetical protein
VRVELALSCDRRPDRSCGLSQQSPPSAAG